MSHSLAWITSVPLGIPICLLGLFGNVISICVWRRYIRKKIGSSPSSSIYFIALGVIDSGLLIFFLLTDSLPAAVGSSVRDTYGYNWFFSYIGFPVFFFFIVASIWLLVGLTINRVITVRFPLKVGSYIWTPYSLFIWFSTVWFPVLLSTFGIPVFFIVASIWLVWQSTGWSQLDFL